MSCKNNSFETIQSEDVSYGYSHDSLGIGDDDCLKEVIKKLADKVEELYKKRCFSQNFAENTTSNQSNNEVEVDYTVTPTLKMKKGSRTNTIEMNWDTAKAQGNDEIVKRITEIYSNDKKTLIASSSGHSNIFELKPSDYPLNVIMKAYVNTEKDGMVVAEKVVPISADIETEITPLLEVKKGNDIENIQIAQLNAEVSKLRKEIENLQK